jgi:hypothetical protein
MSEIRNFRPFEKGSLKAFFTVELSSGLRLNSCKLFAKEDGSRWIGWPSERIKDRNGVEGFRPVVEFRDREASDRFRDEILHALDEQHLATKSRPARQAGVPKAQIPPSSNPDDPNFTYPF